MKAMISSLLTLVIFVLCATGLQTDPIWIDSPVLHPASDAMINYSFVKGVGPHPPASSDEPPTEGNITLHYFWVKNPRNTWTVQCPHCSSNHTCGGALPTNWQAAAHDCVLATNGGPFDMKSWSCLGPVIVNGKQVNDEGTKFYGSPCLGMHKNGTWRMGSFTPDSPLTSDSQFDSLLCGFNWLVYDGAVVPTGPGGMIAPRTAVGLNTNGELMVFEASGAQFSNTGLTMNQTAEWVGRMEGVQYAINLDGGGSSVAYYKPEGGVIGCPTGTDFPACFVRFVTTIMCVKSTP